MNVTGALQTGLIGINRNLDNTARPAGDVAGTGRADIPEQASGREQNLAVKESTVSQTDQAPTTKVVTDASEVLGTNIDTRA